MKSKWFYGALFLLLAVLGVKMERNMLSNQEIVVRFTVNGFTQDKAHKAISEVKNQLQDAGVENIQIRELKDGGLKITYYSDLAVSEIQQILSDAQPDSQHSLDTPFEFPANHSDEDFAVYELNVYEIHGHSQIDLNLEGSTVQVNQIKEHLYVLNSTSYTKALDLSAHYEVNKITLQICSRAATFRTLHYNSLPEVRAGPIA
jgi:methionine synthase II (cobalamin-independent)